MSKYLYKMICILSDMMQKEFELKDFEKLLINLYQKQINEISPIYQPHLPQYDLENHLDGAYTIRFKNENRKLFNDIPIQMKRFSSFQHQLSLLKEIVNAPAGHAIIRRIGEVAFVSPTRARNVIEYKVVPKEDLLKYEDFQALGYTQELSEEQRSKAQVEIYRLESRFPCKRNDEN